MDYTLVIVDATGIQDYIFGSNRLRENEGGSYLVDAATGAFAIGALETPHNVKTVEPLTYNARFLPVCPEDEVQAPAEETPTQVEMLYRGGGNLVALFREDGAAKRFERELTKQLLEEAPELHVVVHRQEFKTTTSLRGALAQAFQVVARRKAQQPAAMPLMGLSVTRLCRATGHPAVGFTGDAGDPEEGAALREGSAAVLARHRAVEAARRRLRETLLPPPEPFDYPQSLVELGQTPGQDNHIAVVHIDGNGMGLRQQKATEAFGTPEQNREFIRALRAFSEQLREAGLGALRDTCRVLAAHVWDDLIAGPEGVPPLRLARRTGQPVLPLLPLVVAGDDSTLVTDGRLGLSVALLYLDAFEAYTEELPGGEGPADACAGVAIVRTHYPFYRAYALAEALCGNAKQKRGRYIEGSWMDWHLAKSGLFGDIHEIRRREYMLPDGVLELAVRPVAAGRRAGRPLEKEQGTPFDWRWVAHGLADFQGGNWPRVKLNDLQEAFRRGKEASELFLGAQRELTLPVLPNSGLQSLAVSGWSARHCCYFDALELHDTYIPL